MDIKNIIVVNDFNYIQGGASKVAIQTANMLAESNSNLKVYFFSAVNSDKSELNDKVIKITTSQTEAMKNKNKLQGFIDGIYNFKAKKEFENLLKTLNRDETIIHFHGWTKALSSSVFHIAFKMNYKVVLTMHDYFTACPNGGYFNYKSNEICRKNPLSFECIKCNCDSRNYFFKLYRIVRQFVQNKIVKLNSRLKHVISISEFSEKILKNTLNSNIKIHRVYNPIDLDSNRTKVDYTKNDYYLFVGRITKEKGVDIFCDAITNTNKKGIVVGDGSELNNLKTKYNNIEFVGWKNSNEAKEYMKGAKALIIPSRWYEGAPLVPLEAMQYGIPVITSNCNATIDYITEGKNGYIFKDNKELEDKINLVEKEKIECEFNYKNDYLEELIKCYNQLF